MLEQRDAIVLARDHLKKHPEECKVLLRPTVGRSKNPKDHGDKLHEHGSISCVAAFLGEHDSVFLRTLRCTANQMETGRDNRRLTQPDWTGFYGQG